LRHSPPSPATRTPSTAKPQPAAPRGGGRVNAESGDSVAAMRTASTAMRGRWGRGGSAASAGGGVGLGTWNEDGERFSEISVARPKGGRNSSKPHRAATWQPFCNTERTEHAHKAHRNPEHRNRANP
jgi:hypothetical protein